MGDKSDDSILELRNVISLRYSFYGGWRNVKILSSGECRKIRDCCIFRVSSALSSASTTSKYFCSQNLVLFHEKYLTLRK